MEILRNYTHSPVALPIFSFWRGTKDIDQVHLLALRQVPSPRALIFHAIVWPLAVIFNAVRVLQAHAATLKQASVPRLTLLRSIIWLGWRHNVGADEALKMHYWVKKNAAYARFYVQEHERISLASAIHRGGEVERVHDKAVFDEEASKKGLPVIPVLALSNASGIVWKRGLSELPRRSLFLKPTDAYKGQGAERWLYSAEDQRWNSEGRCLSADDLLAHFKSLGAQRPVILQPFDAGHPRFRGLSPFGLLVYRIVTCRTASGDVDVVYRLLSMTAHGGVSSKANHGGIISFVDDRGEMGLGYMYTPGVVSSVSRHPNSGATIEGEAAPLLSEATELAITAQREFPEASTVGWDIGLSSVGPVVLEGNPIWGAGGLQLTGRPLGQTTWLKLYLDIRRERSG